MLTLHLLGFGFDAWRLKYWLRPFLGTFRNAGEDVEQRDKNDVIKRALTLEEPGSPARPSAGSAGRCSKPRWRPRKFRLAYHCHLRGKTTLMHARSDLSCAHCLICPSLPGCHDDFEYFFNPRGNIYALKHLTDDIESNTVYY